MRKRLLGTLAAALVATAAGSAQALTVPFTEEFSSGTSGWLNNANTAVGFEASGGPDSGSYVSTSFDYFGFSNPFGGGPVVFRGNDSANASGDAFYGGLVSFEPVKGDFKAALKECAARNLRVLGNPGRIRVATHVFTQPTELNALFDALDRGLR